MYVYIYKYVYIYMSIYICMYVCMFVHVYMYTYVIIYPSNHLGGHQPNPAGPPRVALQGPPRGLSLEHGAWTCQGWQVVAAIGTPRNKSQMMGGGSKSHASSGCWMIITRNRAVRGRPTYGDGYGKQPWFVSVSRPKKGLSLVASQRYKKSL